MPILLALINAKDVCATRFESRAIIEAEAEYFKGPIHKHFAHYRSVVASLRTYSLHKWILMNILSPATLMRLTEITLDIKD